MLHGSAVPRPVVFRREGKTELRFLTAGESHGRGLVAVLEGMPAGVSLSRDRVAGEQERRCWGYGRGRRMQIRKENPIFLSGLRHGETIGSPVAIYIPNGERREWAKIMSPHPGDRSAALGAELRRPRPGHADLAGAAERGPPDATPPGPPGPWNDRARAGRGAPHTPRPARPGRPRRCSSVPRPGKGRFRGAASARGAHRSGARFALGARG